jgi:hypothetical protein
MNAVLRCDCHTTGAHLRRSLETGFDAIYVGDDPLEDWDDPRFWFQVDADRNRRRHIRLPGLGWRLGLTRRELAAMSGLGSKKLGRALREGELPELLRLAD